MTKLRPAITPDERARREAALRHAQGSLRMSELTIDAETLAIFQRHVEGELTLEELGAAIDQLNDQHYGPVRKSDPRRVDG